MAASAGGDKGPPFDPYQYLQASVGAPGIRGIAGKHVFKVHQHCFLIILRI